MKRFSPKFLKANGEFYLILLTLLALVVFVVAGVTENIYIMGASLVFLIVLFFIPFTQGVYQNSTITIKKIGKTLVFNQRSFPKKNECAMDMFKANVKEALEWGIKYAKENNCEITMVTHDYVIRIIDELTDGNFKKEFLRKATLKSVQKTLYKSSRRNCKNCKNKCKICNYKSSKTKIEFYAVSIKF